MKIDKGTVAVYSNSRLVIPGRLYGRYNAAMHRLMEVPHTRGKRIELCNRLSRRFMSVLAAKSDMWEYDYSGKGLDWQRLPKVD